MFARIISLFCLISPTYGQESDVYVNKLSTQAARSMESVASKDAKSLKTEIELVEWAKARLAWIALKRLEGREKEALSIFEGCGDICRKFGSEKEWLAQKSWGCQKKREANPCLSSKTKAQKPPR